jgi:class 3 adenylate cyclase
MLRYLAELRSLPAAATIAAGIFLIDTLTSLHFAVASLYVIVVLIAAHDLRRRGIVITGVTCAFLTVMSYVIMHGVVVDGAAPLRFAVSLISILIATILVLRNVSANQRVKEVERERASLARFFSPKIVDQLVDIHTPFSFARRQPATVLFADMIGFTAYSSGKPPDVVISMLRDLLRFLSEAVFSNQGSVDKYLGDGLMAFFGPAPDEPARCHKRGYVCPGNREIDRMLEPAARPLHREVLSASPLAFITARSCREMLAAKNGSSSRWSGTPGITHKARAGSGSRTCWVQSIAQRARRLQSRPECRPVS